MSLVFNKSNKHTTIYDSYKVELAAKYIKSKKLTNFTEICSFTNEKKNMTLTIWCKNICYTNNLLPGLATALAPRLSRINWQINTVYQELIDEDAYDTSASDDRLYLDLRARAGYTTEMEKLEKNDSKINLSIQLKALTIKKRKLKIWVYSLGEYLYVLSRQGFTLRHKTYSIVQEGDDFLEWINKQ